MEEQGAASSAGGDHEWTTVGVSPKLATVEKIGSADNKALTSKRGSSVRKSPKAKDEIRTMASNIHDPSKKNVNSTIFVARPSLKSDNCVASESTSLFVSEIPILTKSRGRLIGNRGATCKGFATHFQVTITIKPSNDNPNEQLIVVESSSNESNVSAMEAINSFMSTGRTSWSTTIHSKDRTRAKSHDSSKEDLPRSVTESAVATEPVDAPLPPAISSGPTWSSIAKSMPTTAPVPKAVVPPRAPPLFAAKKPAKEKKTSKQNVLSSQSQAEPKSEEDAYRTLENGNSVAPLSIVEIVEVNTTSPVAAPVSSWAGKVRGSSA